ncbi:MAG: hypothetical protein R3B99_33395 [Polyangiales bacterium]
MSARSFFTLFLFTLFVAGCGNDGPSMQCEGGDCWCDAAGYSISESWLCDGDNDCGDWQDERGCPGVRIPELPCFGLSCWCDGGGEIESHWVCDGEVDCDGGEDEHDCQLRDTSSGGGSSGGGSSSGDTGNEACWDCDLYGCTLYYAPACY